MGRGPHDQVVGRGGRQGPASQPVRRSSRPLPAHLPANRPSPALRSPTHLPLKQPSASRVPGVGTRAGGRCSQWTRLELTAWPHT